MDKPTQQTTTPDNTINVCIMNGLEVKEIINNSFKLLTCHLCMENFLNFEELDEHYQYCSRIICEKCQVTFSTSEELELHENDCSIYHCNICPKRFISAVTLRIHQMSKHSTFNCDFCNEKFINDFECETHKNGIHHFLCEGCNKTFDSSLVAVKHRLANVPGDKLLCSLCYGSFQYLPKIKKEVISDDRTNNMVISTEDTTFLIPQLATSDINQNTEMNIIEKYVCIHCDNLFFDSMAQLNSHVRDYHTNPFLDENDKDAVTALDKYEKQIDSLFDTNILQSDFEKQLTYSCIVCSKVYKSFSTYCRHVYHVHKINLLLGSSKKYHCYECRVDKNKLGDLNNHLYSKHENSFPCEYCTKTFSLKKDLKVHILKQHPTEPAFNCIDCTNKFHTHAELKKHCLWHWYQEIVECTVCSKHIKGKKKLKEHMRFHTAHGQEDNYTCHQCGKTFALKTSLQGHLRNVHGEDKKDNVLCGDCGMLVSFKKFKKHYVRSHSKGQVFLCPVCPRTFFCKDLLRQHSDSHVIGKPHVCKMCPAAFKQLRNLRVHVRNYHSAKNNFCKLCSIKFETKEEFSKHKAEEHVDKFTKIDEGYKCGYCPKVVKSIRAMSTHMRLVHEEHITLKCPKCDQKFAFAAQLQNHMSTHSGPKPELNCSSCGKMFTTLGSLNSHIKWVHIGERNFQCSYCPSRFKRKDAQIVHERTHTDERPYTCNVCERKFRQRTDCKRHEAKHTLPGFKYNRPHRVRPKDVLVNRMSADEVVIEEVVEGVEEEQMDTSDALMLLEMPTQEDHQAAAFLSYIVQS